MKEKFPGLKHLDELWTTLGKQAEGERQQGRLNALKGLGYTGGDEWRRTRRESAPAASVTDRHAGWRPPVAPWRSHGQGSRSSIG